MTAHSRHWLLLGLVVWLTWALVPACSSSSSRGGGDDDNDDGSADTDTDTDTDGDSDADSDGDEQLPCPMGSGWPCACDNPSGDCDDGSPCAVVSQIGNDEIGYCALECADAEPVCPETPFSAEAQCLVTILGNPQPFCALVCEDIYDCPYFQACQDTQEDYKLCHP